MKKKKFFIIGSNSFSGSSFVNFLLNNGNKVVGVSRSRVLKKNYSPYFSNKNLKNYLFYKIDLNNDIQHITRAILKFKPNIIINYAAQGMVAESWDWPLDWYKTNFISQVKLIESIRSFKFIEKFINFTTPEVYGSTKKNIKENNFFNPTTPYAISRSAFDMHLNAYYKAYNFPVIFTRTANVYGPFQPLYRIIPKSIISFKKKNKINLDGGGLSRRSFIHINDVSSALYKISLKGELGETYHISSKKLISIKDLLKLISKKMNVDYDKYVNVVEDRIGKDDLYHLNSLKLRSKLGWSDKIDIDNGILDVQKWINSNFTSLKKESLVYNHKK